MNKATLNMLRFYCLLLLIGRGIEVAQYLFNPAIWAILAGAFIVSDLYFMYE